MVRANCVMYFYLSVCISSVFSYHYGNITDNCWIGKISINGTVMLALHKPSILQYLNSILQTCSFILNIAEKLKHVNLMWKDSCMLVPVQLANFSQKVNGFHMSFLTGFGRMWLWAWKKILFAMGMLPFISTTYVRRKKHWLFLAFFNLTCYFFTCTKSWIKYAYIWTFPNAK